MLTTILSLFGGGGLGAILRYIPEIMKMLNAKGDRDHEFKMTELQLKIDSARAGQALDLVHAQSDASQLSGQMEAYATAIKVQGQLTGVKWVDALNASVRPVIAYWWQGLFTAYKVTIITDAWMNFTTLKTFEQEMWTPQDAAMFSMILGFWYVDRVIRKDTGK